MPPPKRKIDWRAIEKDYRAGSMTNVDLAAWYSLSEGAIRKHAKANGWVRGGTTEAAPSAPGTIATLETTSPEAIIGRGRNLTLRLLDELDATTSRLGELQAMIDDCLDGEADKKAREALEQALSLKTRSDVLKSLALTAKTLSEAGAASGKKAESKASAERAVAQGGKFAPPAPPKLIVSNK